MTRPTPVPQSPASTRRPGVPEQQRGRLGLTAPLTILGAVAGWFSGKLATLLGLVPLDLDVGLAVGTAFLGLLVGRHLQKEEAAGGDRGLRAARLVGIQLLVGGPVLGALFATRHRQSAIAPLLGVAAGLGLAVSLVILGGFVIAAARRAAAARPGSLAGRSARRHVWVTTAAATAVATLPVLPDWPAWLLGDRPAPVGAIALSLVAILVAVGSVAADARALVRLRRACRGRRRMEAWEGDLATSDADRIDLGVGTEVVGWVDRGTSAYRGRERPLWLVVGDPLAAREMLRDAIGRGLAATAFAALVLCAHSAAGLQGRVLYEELRCAAGHAETCASAAHRLEQQSLAEPLWSRAVSTAERARELRTRACALGDASSCAKLSGSD